MNRLDRYLIRSILSITGIVALALLTIFTFTSFVGDLGTTGKGGYGVRELALYTLLNMPSGLYTLLPIIAMLGTLLGLGNLASQGELTAIRTAGVSKLRIGTAALMAGLIVGLFGWVLGDWIAPIGRQAAERLKTEARYGVDSGAAFKPVWLRDGEHIFHIGRLQSERRIGAVVAYTLADDLRLRAVTTIKEGRYEDDHWSLSGVETTYFEEQGTRIEKQEHSEWRGSLSPQVLRLFVLEARSLSAAGLIQLIDYLQANGLDFSRQQLDLWRKFVAPATVMAMMLFATPFVFGSLRGGGSGVRLMVGVLIGVGFYVVNEVTASFGQLYGWPPSVAAGLPTAALALLGWLGLTRLR